MGYLNLVEEGGGKKMVKATKDISADTDRDTHVKEKGQPQRETHEDHERKKEQASKWNALTHEFPCCVWNPCLFGTILSLLFLVSPRAPSWPHLVCLLFPLFLGVFYI